MKSDQKTRIVFMGTPEFAATILNRIYTDGFRIAGVVTVPDKPAGRGRSLRESPVKQFAEQHRLPLLQPEKLRDPGFLDKLAAWKPDVIVVVAFRMLPDVVWQMPPLGTFNLHASLLPQYRGAAPINHVIMNGETETGVSTFLLDKEIDTGQLLLQKKIPISDKMSAGDLHDLLMQVGAELTVQTIQGLTEKTLQPLPQEISAGTVLKPAPKIYKADCRIPWDSPAQNIYDHIRGLSPYPGAWSVVQTDQGKRLTIKIFESSIEESSDLESGVIRRYHNDQLSVGTKTNNIRLQKIQIEGKKPMTISEFLNGFRTGLEKME